MFTVALSDACGDHGQVPEGADYDGYYRPAVAPWQYVEAVVDMSDPPTLKGMDQDLVVTAAGFDFRHGRDFVIDRPLGSRDWLFAYFTTAIRLIDQDGERAHAAGTGILYPPGQRQWYRGDAAGFANHWFHMEGAAVAPLVAVVALPIGLVFQCPPERIALPLRSLAGERFRALPHWNIACSGLVREVLVAAARAAMPPAHGIPAALVERLHDLRARVHAQLAHRWTVASMSKSIGLSPSRFASVYREVHGASPFDDLIAARIERAQWLLSVGQTPVVEVAATIGFADVGHFSRIFRSRVGCSPRAYRSQAQGS